MLVKRLTMEIHPYQSTKDYMLDTWEYTKEVYEEWSADNCFRLAAALSYYTIFSLAPIILIVISVAGIFFGREAVSGEVYGQISGLVGSEAAKEVESLVQNAYLQKSSFFMTVVGIGTLVLSATVTFTVLQDSLNTIWKVKAHPERGIIKFLIARGLSLGLVFAVGFLLIVSLVLEALLSALQNYIGPQLETFDTLITASQWGISLAVIMLLFALMFKYLPDVIVPWKEVWKASLLTAVLFTIGRVVIGFYLGRSNLASSYGAAASVIIIMVWVNYSSLIFFLGAEWIYVKHKRNGRPIVPIRYAVRVHTSVVEEKIETHARSRKKTSKPSTKQIEAKTPTKRSPSRG